MSWIGRSPDFAVSCKGFRENEIHEPGFIEYQPREYGNHAAADMKNLQFSTANVSLSKCKINANIHLNCAILQEVKNLTAATLLSSSHAAVLQTMTVTAGPSAAAGCPGALKLSHSVTKFINQITITSLNDTQNSHYRPKKKENQMI